MRRRIAVGLIIPRLHTGEDHIVQCLAEQQVVAIATHDIRTASGSFYSIVYTGLQPQNVLLRPYRVCTRVLCIVRY
jgi:hypothetical protein